jgi:hypothetical protein
MQKIVIWGSNLKKIQASSAATPQFKDIQAMDIDNQSE